MRKVSVLVGAEIGVIMGGAEIPLPHYRIRSQVELLRTATRYGDRG